MMYKKVVFRNTKAMSGNPMGVTYTVILDVRLGS